MVFGSIDSREPGTIAVAYYGGDGTTYRGFVAESHDALSDAPTFWSVAIDDRGTPLFSQGFDIGYSEVLTGGDLVEMSPVRYAANGDIWAAFVEDMCPGPGSMGPCNWDLGAHAMSPYQGVIARIAH